MRAVTVCDGHAREGCKGVGTLQGMLYDDLRLHLRVPLRYRAAWYAKRLRVDRTDWAGLGLRWVRVLGRV
jgi:hypothetical protein